MFWKKKDKTADTPSAAEPRRLSTDRRTCADRRELIRYEPNKEDRRKGPRDKFR